MNKEFGQDEKTIELSDYLQSINATIAEIRAEERKLKKYLEKLKASRAELDARYNKILSGKL